MSGDKQTPDEARAAAILERVRRMAAEMSMEAPHAPSSTTKKPTTSRSPEQNDYWRVLRSAEPLPRESRVETCATCGDTGLISYDVPIDDPRFGRAFPCPAPGCPVRQAREQQILAQKFKSSGLTGEQAKFRLTDSFFQQSQFATAVGAVERLLSKRKFTASESPDHARHAYHGLYLYGPYGVGKSALAAATVTAFLEAGVAAHFEEVKRLLDWLRSGLDSENAADDFDQRLNALRQVPVLVLDDFGAHQTTAWAIAQVEDVVDHRYVNRGNGLVTVVTSNHSMADMAEELADVNEGAGWRIYSRLRGMLFPIEIIGPDARLAQQRG